MKATLPNEAADRRSISIVDPWRFKWIYNRKRQQRSGLTSARPLTDS